MHRHSMGALLWLLLAVLVPSQAAAQDPAPAARDDKPAADKEAVEDSTWHRARPPRSVPDAAIIARTINGGSLVVLRDGSVWEVYLPDRPATATWESGDAVRVRQRPAPIGEFDYDLYYGPRRGRVAVRFAGWTEGGGDTR